MSDYSHSIVKFATTGLQLRLPVDLIPSTQYGRLTNAIPTIEGELRTRDGLTLIADIFVVAAVSVISRVNGGTTDVTLATTIYPNGYIVGETVVLTISALSPTAVNSVTLGTYSVTITAIISTTQFSFTPAIPGTWVTGLDINVFGQAVASGPTTTLAARVITNIFRLNQALPSITGDRLVAMSGRLFRAPLPDGDTFVELVLPSLSGESPTVVNGFSGSPMSIVNFRFTLDTASWAIITDGTIMVKYRQGEGATTLFFKLGNPIPLLPATAVADGAGNLNSTGGTEYDWRYTYFDGYVSTEGNPSPGTDTGTIETVFSSSQINPNPRWTIVSPFYTNVPFTGVSNTGGSGHVDQAVGAIPPSNNVFNQCSCIWLGFTNPSATPFVITLQIDWTVTINHPDPGQIQAQLMYSIDAGASFTTFATVANTSISQTSTVDLPLGTDLTKVQFQCYGFAAGTSTSHPVGGGFLTVDIENIQINCNLSPTAFTLALVNQKAKVTVQAPGALNDGRITGIRLYRRGGSLPDAWRLVGTYPLSTLGPASFGPTLAGAGANGPSGGLVIPWTNPNNVTSGALFATVALAFGEVSAQVLVTTFGFVISTGTIIGITVTCEVNTTVLGPNIQAQLLKSGVGSSSLKNNAATVGVSTITFGGPSDLWGGTFSPSDVSQTGFGVTLLANGVPFGGATVSLRNVQIDLTVSGFFDLEDNVSDTTLSTAPLLQFDNDAPVTSVSTMNQPLSFFWGPSGIDARMLGCGDPNRPECVYFSKPGNPDAWPPQNFLEVSDPGTPVIAGCVYNTQTFAFSRERIYQLIEGYIPGITYTSFVTPSAHGLYSPWAFCVGPAIYFVSKDGIYETTGGIEQSIVENDIKPLFPTYDALGQDVEDYEAIDYAQPNAMRLRYHNEEVYFLYIGATTGTRQMLIYDILKKRWRAGEYTVGISEAYSEPATTSSLLMGTNAGSIYRAGGDHDPDELDVIENAIIGQIAAFPITLGAGTYYARMSRFDVNGEVALSNESQGIVVDGTHGIAATFPEAPPGTVKWRVYYGTVSGGENQYKEYTEAQIVAALRNEIIVSPGTAGAPPTINADSDIVVLLRTGAQDQGMPLNRKQYGNVIFDLDPGGADVTNPITITPYINGEASAETALLVTGTGRQQVPLDLSDVFAFNLEFQVEWVRATLGSGAVIDPVLFQFDVLHFLEPVGVKHWQSQPTSFEFPGFVHCRDAYIAIRSTSVVTLTVTIDGVIVQTYSIPSTSGQRLKQYVQFNSNKGLLYQFSLDGDVEFRTYSPDLEIRVKPWLGVLGYAIQRVLGGEVG